MLEITVEHDLGNFGPREGSPVVYHWPLYLHLLRLLPWVALLVLLLLKPNRSVAAWSVLLPALIVSVAIGLVAALLAAVGGSFPAIQTGFSLSLGLSAVWLLGHRISSGNRLLAVVQSLVVFSAMEVVAVLAGTGVTVNALWEIISYVLCGVILLLAIVLASAWCRKRYTVGRYLVGLAVACMLCSTVAGLIAFAVMALSGGMPLHDVSALVPVLGGLLGAGLVLGLIMAGLLLPFVILAVKNKLYRERLYGTVRLPGMQPAGGGK